MYKIKKQEFNLLKKQFEAWAEDVLHNGYASVHYSEGIVIKEADNLFAYPINAISIAISAHCSHETGGIYAAFLDDIEIIDDENNQHKGYQIDEGQTNELKNILKRI